jgi:hypothetical protein
MDPPVVVLTYAMSLREARVNPHAAVMQTASGQTMPVVTADAKYAVGRRCAFRGVFAP